ncbi:MAG: hypothetical protein A2749_02645 [Parcubacteria group bacterium RIFCSPHIGHO2_01_FULL_45_26]|nr:MAG: hypothetical protein A2749_02645 [Parcubacteria group bacterium RIFCSPHIGHO2_01_FULL_45_26]
MPVIKVWLLPAMEKEAIELLYANIWEAIEGVPELGLSYKRPQDVTILFPEDKIQKGLDEYFLVEVTNLTPKPGRTSEVRLRLADALRKLVQAWFPDAKFIEVVVTQKHDGDIISVYDEEAKEE